ncbi:MBL fold metallo-hydrolase [Metallosphaera tengchongensis]|uniref:MBL fold metallo-hydrolase n=1 Tax=Metallosphaera tengchongensis TaxID=1532350 RepID=A0A6N0NZZ0_9CREN|nr:MBL fold metallo-hydrolase [Metallosphaera tengchongensis]QKR00620.1 MBL fold metallo-hydrolase [Metallosphaera tengchongensis]
MKTVSRLSITILSDNFSSTLMPPLMGEWGFSAYIETDNAKILYDVGNSGIPLLHNSRALGIDLESVDYLVLSHGHLDHTGGLRNEELRRKLRGKVILAHPGIFDRKFINWRDKMEYIGLPVAIDEEFRPILTREPIEFASGIMFSGEVKNYGFPRYVKGMYKATDAGLAPDLMLDDTALYINVKDKGLVIVTGCGHSGILNVLNHAREVTGVRKVIGTVGGLHLLSSDPKEVQEVMDRLKTEVIKISPAHCSGNLAKVLAGEKYQEAGVGSVLNFEDIS